MFVKVPRYIVGESEKEASKEGRSFTDFRYACVGYSVYLDQKSRSTEAQKAQTELPVCVGLEVSILLFLFSSSLHALFRVMMCSRISMEK